MVWKYIHLIKGDGFHIAYHYPSNRILSLNQKTYQILESLKHNHSIQEVYEEYGIQETELVALGRAIESYSLKSNPQEKNIEKKKRSISRITLHVSNDCNLRCKYCYASGGNYKQERTLMTKEQAKEIVDFCVRNFDEVNSLVFFGGEPMLNLPIMIYICQLFERYYAEGCSSFMPKFSIITNGTILNKNILAFIQRYISSITVSVDGPMDVNDTNRIDRKGNGSYERISRFIRAIKSETNTYLRFEATFTQAHRDAGYTHEDIKNFMWKNFQIKGVVVDEKHDAGNLLNDSILLNKEKVLQENFSNMPNGFWQILDSIVCQTPVKLCPIVNDVFSINCEGHIYPCHILTGKKEMDLGNVKGSNIINDSVFNGYVRSDFELKKNEICSNCWGQNLCGGCALNKYYNAETQKLGLPNDSVCQNYLSYLEKILLFITTIRKDDILWKNMVEKMKQEK